MKKAGVVLLPLLFINLCLAQGGKESLGRLSKPNFSGTWMLDLKESDFDGRKSDLIYDSLTLIISHQDPELKITRKIVKKKKERSQKIVYYTDSREEKNPSFNERATVQSKTHWQSDILITKGIVSTPIFGDVILSDTTDKWELSADGNSLIQTSSSSPLRSKLGKFNFGSFGAWTFKKVFRKRP
jgi:hypothetical protein